MKLEHHDVALVTGASRGLGVHIAKALARKGLRLVLAARSADELEAVASALQREGVEALAVTTDVNQPEELQGLVDRAMDRYGRVDVLVNNAGIEHAMPFDRVDLRDMQHTVGINLLAPMMLTRLLLPGMIAQGRGHVVNICSLAGVMPSPYEELYTATKHGLVGFTRSLRASAKDMKWPIGASAICPGFMDGSGMYEDMKRDYAVIASSLMGTTHASRLGPIVIKAIEHDMPDVLLMNGSPRLAVASLALAPRLFEWLSARLDANALFRKMAAVHASQAVCPDAVSQDAAQIFPSR
jgi:short-subunit dehydrogenase